MTKLSTFALALSIVAFAISILSLLHSAGVIR